MRGLPLWIFAYALVAFAAAGLWQLASSATAVVSKAAAANIERTS